MADADDTDSEMDGDGEYELTEVLVPDYAELWRRMRDYAIEDIKAEARRSRRSV